jgi:hypothetical protein
MADAANEGKSAGGMIEAAERVLAVTAAEWFGRVK